MKWKDILKNVILASLGLFNAWVFNKLFYFVMMLFAAGVGLILAFGILGFIPFLRALVNCIVPGIIVIMYFAYYRKSSDVGYYVVYKLSQIFKDESEDSSNEEKFKAYEDFFFSQFEGKEEAKKEYEKQQKATEKDFVEKYEKNLAYFGINKDSQFTIKDIEKAFKKMLKKLHPDVNKSPDAEEQTRTCVENKDYLVMQYTQYMAETGKEVD